MNYQEFDIQKECCDIFLFNQVAIVFQSTSVLALAFLKGGINFNEHLGSSRFELEFRNYS